MSHLSPRIRHPQRSYGKVRRTVRKVCHHTGPFACFGHMAGVFIAARFSYVIIKARDSRHRVQNIDAVAVKDTAAAVVHDKWRIDDRYYVIPRSCGNIHLVGFQASNCVEILARRISATAIEQL